MGLKWMSKEIEKYLVLNQAELKPELHTFHIEAQLSLKTTRHISSRTKTIVDEDDEPVSMFRTRLNRPGYGVEIDQSKVIPSITRPVWEPPALDVLDICETKEWEDNLDGKILRVPDIAIRTQLEDIEIEFEVREEYRHWVKATGKDAIVCGDKEKERFYEGLLKALRDDCLEDDAVLTPLTKEFWPESYVPDSHGKVHEGDFRLRPQPKLPAFTPIRRKTNQASISIKNADRPIIVFSKAETMGPFTKPESAHFAAFGLDNINSPLTDCSRTASQTADEEINEELDEQIRQEPERRLAPVQPYARTSSSLPPFSIDSFLQSSTKRREATQQPTAHNLPSSEGVHREIGESIDLSSSSTDTTTSPKDIEGGDLIDLNPSTTDTTTSPADLRAIWEATGIYEMSEVDRLLS